MNSETIAILVGAITAGTMAIIGMVSVGIVLVIQTQRKLEIIRVDVNSNLTTVKLHLAAAMRILNEDRVARGLEPIVPEQLAAEEANAN